MCWSLADVAESEQPLWTASSTSNPKGGDAYSPEKKLLSRNHEFLSRLSQVVVGTHDTTVSSGVGDQQGIALLARGQ